MACFTDTPYANWSYNLLITLNNAIVEGEGPVTLGCYAAMNPAEQMYQFYKALKQLSGQSEFFTQNCFVQLTEPQQWDALNIALTEALTPPEPDNGDENGDNGDNGDGDGEPL
jgi:hypothetical protein